MKAISRAKVKIAMMTLSAVVAGGVGGPVVCGAEAGDAGASKGPADTVLDRNSLWRYFGVSRCSYVRTAEGTLEPRDITWYWGGIRSKPAASTTPSPLPPADWADPAFDDSLWPRVRLPQPVLTVAGANPRPFYLPYATAVVVLRGKFEVTDPARVQSCSLSLDYWGGAVVSVNGKEVARGHAPAAEKVPGTLTSGYPVPFPPAQDYPLEAFITSEGKPLRVGDPKNQDHLALRERRLADVKIPAHLLRKGTNVLAIEIRQAPVPEIIAKGVGQELSRCGWPPIGLLNATLTVSPVGAATPSRRPKGIQVWNCAPYETITAFDYGDPVEALRPIAVFAARNGVFSGRLAVSSDQAIRNLKVTVTDLAPPEGGGRIPASAVRVRYAEPAVAEKSWAPPHRFDGLLDAIPAEIPVFTGGPPRRERFYRQSIDRKNLTAGAVASLWLTVRAPKDAKPGRYEGTVSVTADGMEPTIVPLRVTISNWTLPDPKDFRVQNFAYFSDEALARHYGVQRWSDKHFELMGKSLALMAEVNSRQVFINLAIDFYGLGSNQETVVRWIKQPDGSYKHDFTVFDKYLDMIAKATAKPLPLRLNCWGEVGKDGKNASGKMVSVLDPATGKVEPMEQPTFGTEESYRFWKPVIDEVLKRIKARGWLDVTSLGHNSYCWAVKPPIVDVAYRLWPEGVWSHTAHNGRLGGKFTGTDKGVVMPTRYADTVWGAGKLTARGYRALLKPRPGFWCFTYRGCFRDGSPLTDLRRIAEDEIMSGHDGISDFGADLFPFRDARGRYRCVGNGRGTGGPGNSTKAVLAPGTEGPIASERFEMFREGVQLAEAILFIQRAIEEKKISGDLEQRANRYLDARGEAFLKGWFGVRYVQAEQDEKLLDLAGEVARSLEQR